MAAITNLIASKVRYIKYVQVHVLIRASKCITMTTPVLIVTNRMPKPLHASPSRAPLRVEAEFEELRREWTRYRRNWRGRENRSSGSWEEYRAVKKELDEKAHKVRICGMMGVH